MELAGRWTILLTVWCYRSVSSVGFANGGYDAMILNAAWLLFLGDATATLSLDSIRRTGRLVSDRLISAWPRYLLIFQLVLIYTLTGMQKSSASWTAADGFSAIYWFLQDPTWLHFDASWTRHILSSDPAAHRDLLALRGVRRAAAARLLLSANKRPIGSSASLDKSNRRPPCFCDHRSIDAPRNPDPAQHGSLFLDLDGLLHHSLEPRRMGAPAG